MWSLINVSSNLHTTDVKITGLSFSGLFVDTFRAKTTVNFHLMIMLTR